MRHPPRFPIVVFVVALLFAGCASDDSSDDTSTSVVAATTTEATTTTTAPSMTTEPPTTTKAMSTTMATSDESLDVGRGLVPVDVVALIDEWKQATDDSIVDLYTPTGYHLYGSRKFTDDNIARHLTSSTALAVGHEMLTPLLLVADELGRWVVTQGVENTTDGGKYPSGISWEIIETSDGDLKIASSAWFKVTR